MPNIAVIWDFDGTLSPDDSTTKTVEYFGEFSKGSDFWEYIRSLRGDANQAQWEHVLASDAPIWLYALSKIAAKRNVPLNDEFFRNFILPEIKLYPNVLNFLQRIKDLSNTERFKESKLDIYHFIVSAGLKDLVEQVFPKNLIHWTFGCRYEVVIDESPDKLENIPVFCMDETMKTRSLFEISKGSFFNPEKSVNVRVPERWVPFENMIYIGDGDTDIPALSLVRDQGGTGIAVYNPERPKRDIKKKLERMSLDKRADLITKSDFSLDGELFKYIENRCLQICQRYEAASFCTTQNNYVISQ